MVHRTRFGLCSLCQMWQAVWQARKDFHNLNRIHSRQRVCKLRGRAPYPLHSHRLKETNPQHILLCHFCSVSFSRVQFCVNCCFVVIAIGSL